MSNIDLQLGDCLELMRQMPDKSIDLIVTDPPYMMTQAKCDKSRLDVDLISKEFRRIIKDKCAWVVFGQTKSVYGWLQYNYSLFKYSIVWHKRACTGYLDANNRPLRVYELINVFGMGKVTYNPQMTSGRPYTAKRGASFEGYGKADIVTTRNSGERYPVDVLTVSRDPASDIKHPFKKPVALMEWLVKTYSNPGDTVLDPFMGSGTTGAACMQTGRNFIGFEIDPTYYQIAQKRIEEAQCQLVTIS